MKIEWKEAFEAIYDSVLNMDGQAEKWCEMMWFFIDKKGLNTYHSLSEKISVYSRLNGIVKIYYDFQNQSREYYASENYFLDINLQDQVRDILEDDESTEEYCDFVKSLISINSDKCITSLIIKEFNTSTLYSMLTYFLEDYTNEEDYDDVEEEINAIDEYKLWFTNNQKQNKIISELTNDSTLHNMRMYNWVEELLSI